MQNRHWQTWAHHQVNGLPRHSHVTASVHSVDLAKMCGHARLIAAPHSRQRFPVWLHRFPHRLENNRCRRAVQHGETASGSTMKEPWPKPVDDSQKARIPARRALHPFPEISAPEVSKSQGVFSRRSLHNKTNNPSSSTVRSGECEADAEEERLFIPIRVRVAYDQRRPRRRRILL